MSKEKKIREVLETYFQKSNANAIAEIEGITIIVRRQNFPDETDCFSYALEIPFSPKLISEAKKVIQLPPIENPNKGDYVLYQTEEDNAKHIGLLQIDHTVISKWDKLHVYRHPIMYVPTSFGNKIKFVKGKN